MTLRPDPTAQTHALAQLVVERLGAGGTITGRVSSRSGSYDSAGAILLEALDKESFDRIGATLDWHTLDGGQRVADFAIEVPADDRYRVVLDTLDSFVWGTVGEASLEQVPLEIALDDRTQCLDIKVTDAESGVALEEAELALTLGLSMDWQVGAHFVLEEIPFALDPGTLGWCVTAEGYAPVFGDLSAFSELRGDCRFLELKLDRQWGNQFEIYDRRTLRPLNDVLVKLDGKAVGRTRAGLLDVRLKETPNTLDIELAGWRWVGGSEDYRREDMLEEEIVPIMLWMIEE